MGTKTQRIADALTGYRSLALDTMCFIYHFEADPEYVSFTHTLFNLIEKGGVIGVTSTLTLAEVLVKPIEQENRDAREDYKYVLTNFPNLTLCDVNSEIVEEAANLKARYGIGLPDAIQVATGIIQEAQAFVTNDQNLRRVRETEVLIIRDFVADEP